MSWRSIPSWLSSSARHAGRRSTGSNGSSLRGKPLALWLHGFYASHAAPYPLRVAYLHKLSGSQTKQLRYFKKNLTQALRDLEAAGAIKSFEIRDDSGSRSDRAEPEPAEALGRTQAPSSPAEIGTSV